VPSDLTFVTELATALGMLGDREVAATLARRPTELELSPGDWGHLTDLWESGRFSTAFGAAFRNGRAFLNAPDALNGRPPRIVEWTGGRRPPGDEVVPSDLRIDHVYLVSCKYLSRILHNPSPARLFERLLTQAPVDDLRDWYERIAPDDYQALYEACVPAVTGPPLPALAADLTKPERRRLALSLRAGWPRGAKGAYASLCRTVSEASADKWQSQMMSRNAEAMLWRLLRIGSAPYFILGSSQDGSMRFRIDTPWDWHRSFRLHGLDIAAQPGGQPRVAWYASYLERRTADQRTVRGHVEIRWSHGRFGQPPEAKVYLDSPHNGVPGYHPL
jgi:hypothetical protein